MWVVVAAVKVYVEKGKKRKTWPTSSFSLQFTLQIFDRICLSTSHLITGSWLFLLALLLLSHSQAVTEDHSRGRRRREREAHSTSLVRAKATEHSPLLEGLSQRVPLPFCYLKPELFTNQRPGAQLVVWWQHAHRNRRTPGHHYPQGWHPAPPTSSQGKLLLVPGCVGAIGSQALMFSR